MSPAKTGLLVLVALGIGIAIPLNTGSISPQNVSDAGEKIGLSGETSDENVTYFSDAKYLDRVEWGEDNATFYLEEGHQASSWEIRHIKTEERIRRGNLEWDQTEPFVVSINSLKDYDENNFAVCIRGEGTWRTEDPVEMPWPTGPDVCREFSVPEKYPPKTIAPYG